MAWITNIAVRSSGTSQHKKGHDSGVCIVFGFLFSLILVGGLPGQMVTSTLRGLITDGSGGVLPGVDITVINLEMNATRSTVTVATATIRLIYCRRALIDWRRKWRLQEVRALQYPVASK